MSYTYREFFPFSQGLNYQSILDEKNQKIRSLTIQKTHWKQNMAFLSKQLEYTRGELQSARAHIDFIKSKNSLTTASNPQKKTSTMVKPCQDEPVIFMRKSSSQTVSDINFLQQSHLGLDGSEPIMQREYAFQMSQKVTDIQVHPDPEITHQELDMGPGPQFQPSTCLAADARRDISLQDHCVEIKVPMEQLLSSEESSANSPSPGAQSLPSEESEQEPQDVEYPIISLHEMPPRRKRWYHRLLPCIC